MTAKPRDNTLTLRDIQGLILTIRGEKVILDSDLAVLYGVPTKRLNEQVSRNHERFPPDFAFQLESQEVTNLKSQFVTSSCYDLIRSVISSCALPTTWHRQDACVTFLLSPIVMTMRIVYRKFRDTVA